MIEKIFYNEEDEKIKVCGILHRGLPGTFLDPPEYPWVEIVDVMRLTEEGKWVDVPEEEWNSVLHEDLWEGMGV